ncbi:MAG: hypothetical protein PHI70_08410 [Proteiniphilum sp.]|nr:hypothetical protein [Fermentimonas sp.]MDD4416787.1 hypothetical protein [Proteiniphilum sp.]
MLLYLVFLTGLLVITWVAAGLMIWLYLRDRKVIYSRIGELNHRKDSFSTGSSKTPIHEKRIKSLEDELKNIRQKLNGYDHSGSKQTPPGKPPMSNSYANPVIESIQPSAVPKSNGSSDHIDHGENDKLWVKRTSDGLHRLELAERPTGIFLVSKGNRYLLHLEKLEPSNLSNIIALYEEVLDIPVGFESIKSLEMEKHPEYEKKNDYFVFQSKGKIKINE